MATLVILSPDGGKRRVEIDDGETILGRGEDLAISLRDPNVSRRHVRIIRNGEGWLVEDLGSRNGTFHNGLRIREKVSLTPGDTLRIGPYNVRLEQTKSEGNDFTIQRHTMAAPENPEIYRENAAHKLQAVLELAHRLANTLEVQQVLERFVEQVLKLLPKTDRVVVILFENDEPVVRMMRGQRLTGGTDRPFSRSLLKQIREQGIAVLAEDTGKLKGNMTLQAMGVRSLLCVPFRAHESAIFGAVQLDRFEGGEEFSAEDLHLLTAVTLQVSIVLEKARLHEKLLQQERIGRELALAREIQVGFLPRERPTTRTGAFDLEADLQMAEEVSGDFYDFIRLDDSRLALVVADVSGKGIPAALFMSLVRVLIRKITREQISPADILTELNQALVPDNPKYMFVTVLLGIFDSATGDLVFSRGGHPAPLLLASGGAAEEIASDGGCLIGIEPDAPELRDTRVKLQVSEAVIFYTDGVTEATNRAGEQYGLGRLKRSIAGESGTVPLEKLIQAIKSDVNNFCAPAAHQDDITLLVLRRGGVGGSVSDKQGPGRR